MRVLLLAAAAVALSACASSPFQNADDTAFDASDVAFAKTLTGGQKGPALKPVTTPAIYDMTTGMDLTMAPVTGETQYRVRFNEDGTVVRQELDSFFARPQSGTWYAAEGKLCVTFDAETCYALYSTPLYTLGEGSDGWVVLSAPTAAQ